MKKIIVSLLAIAFLLPAPASAEMTTNQLIELLISLGVIPAEKVEQARGVIKAPPKKADGFCYNWTKNIKIDDQNEDVSNLASALIKEGLLHPDFFQDARTIHVYDEYLASVVVNFQERYASEILTPNGLTRGSGYVGPATRAVLNRLYSCNSSQNVTTEIKNQNIASIRVVSPNGGETYKKDENMDIRWKSEGGKKVSIYIGYPDGGTCYVDTVKAEKYNYSFVPYGYKCPNIPQTIGSGQYRINLYLDAGKESDIGVARDKSDNFFTVGSGVQNISSSIKVLSPNRGEVIVPSASSPTMQIRWTNPSGFTADNSLVTFNFCTLKDGVRNCPNAGSTNIASGVKNTGVYNASIYNSSNGSATPSGKYVMQIIATRSTDGATAYGYSDSEYVISEKSVSTQPSITALAPLSAKAGDIVRIYGSGFSSKTKNYVDLTLGSGTLTVDGVYVNGSVITFKVPDTAYGNYQVSVNNDEFGYIEGAKTLTILSPSSTNGSTSGNTNTSTSEPSIKVLSPNGGTSVIKGTTLPISWSSKGISKVSVWLCDANQVCNRLSSPGTGITNAGSYSYPVPASLVNGKYTIRVASEDQYPSSTVYDNSDTSFSIISDPAPTGGQFVAIPVSKAYLEATLEKNKEDYAGREDFGSGKSTNGLEEDWKWQIKLNLLEEKEIKSITLIHKVLEGELWSTASNPGFGVKPYPLVVMRGERQLNTVADYSFGKYPAGNYTLTAYGQKESEVVGTMKVNVKFTDGTQATKEVIQPTYTTSSNSASANSSVESISRLFKSIFVK